MHDHRIDGGLLHQHDVAGEASRHLLLAHGVAAVFHDDGLLVVALHMGKRFRQDARDIVGRNGHRGMFRHSGVCAAETNLSLRLFSEPAAGAKEACTTNSANVVS